MSTTIAGTAFKGKEKETNAKLIANQTCKLTTSTEECRLTVKSLDIYKSDKNLIFALAIFMGSCAHELPYI